MTASQRYLMPEEVLMATTPAILDCKVKKVLGIVTGTTVRTGDPAAR